jgi:hypothetical protein
MNKVVLIFVSELARFLLKVSSLSPFKFANLRCLELYALTTTMDSGKIAVISKRKNFAEISGKVKLRLIKVKLGRRDEIAG